MEKRAVHFIASSDKNCADERELINMVNELLGIQYNIAKADRTDRKVQNLASYINEDTLKAIQKTMDKRKAYGIDKVTKEDYERNLEGNLANLVRRMKSGSYRPNPTRRVYIQTLAKTYLKETWYRRTALVLSTAHDTFSRFIVGQCTEAVILGALCTAGMFLFRFPYAAMVGTLIGATALLPVVGAYLGAFVGAFMIFTVSPLQAVGFLVFIAILQQIEGNLIYPRVVGSSVGLPGIWVLCAVTIGGGLSGIIGMLFAVPLTATVYKLIRQDVRKRQAKPAQERIGGK